METSREIYRAQRAGAVSYCVPLSPGKDLAAGVLGEQEEGFRFCCVENTHILTLSHTHIPAHKCTHTYPLLLVHAHTHTHIHTLLTYIISYTHTCSHTYVTKCSLHFLNLKSGRDRGYRNLKLAQSLLTGNRPCQTEAGVCDVKNTGEGLGRWLSS